MLALLLLPLACSGASDEDSAGSVATDTSTSATGPGTLALSFRMDADYIATMAEAGQSPVGPFSGSIYAEADATAIGPNEDAVPLADFSAAAVDLTNGGGPSEILLITEPIEAQIVWVLGCLDADVPTDGCGDPGDPITIPNENKAQVIAGAETPLEVYLGMIRP
jgi:hypothetical protein